MEIINCIYSIYLSVYLSICLSIYLSVFLSICPLTQRIIGASPMISQPATAILYLSVCLPQPFVTGKSSPVHSLTWSSHHFLCLSLLLAPLTVPCKVVFARSDDRET